MVTENQEVRPVCNEKFKALEEKVINIREILGVVQKQNEEMASMNATLRVLTEQVKNTKEDLDEVKKDLKLVKDQPANTYREIKIATAAAFISAVAGVIVGKIL